MCSITSASVLVSNQLKKFAHLLVPIDIAKQVQQEHAWRIITGRSVRGITVSNKRADERKIDKRCDHFGIPTLDIAVGKDFNKAFFKVIF